MIQKTALRVIKSKRLVLLALIMSSILQSLSIVGQAWFFATLIHNLVFLDHTVLDESNTITWLAGIHYITFSVFLYTGTCIV